MVTDEANEKTRTRRDACMPTLVRAETISVVVVVGWGARINKNDRTQISRSLSLAVLICSAPFLQAHSHHLKLKHCETPDTSCVALHSRTQIDGLRLSQEFMCVHKHTLSAFSHTTNVGVIRHCYACFLQRKNPILITLVFSFFYYKVH